MTPREMAKAHEAERAKLLERARIVQRVFATEDGRALLELLEEMFCYRLEGRDEKQIVFNAGRADVVGYLKALSKAKER